MCRVPADMLRPVPEHGHSVGKTQLTCRVHEKLAAPAA